MINDYLVLNSDAKNIGVINPVAAIIYNIVVTDNNYDILKDKIHNEFLILLKNNKKILKQPFALGYKDLFFSLGYEGQMPAGERILNIFIEKGFKYINNIIDAYNIVAAKYCAGIGVHDARNYSGKLIIKRALGEEKIKPLHRDKYKYVKKGDLIYENNGAVMAWLGERDVDSDDFKITSETNKLLVIVLGNKNTSISFNRNIIKEIYENIKITCEHAKIIDINIEVNNV